MLQKSPWSYSKIIDLFEMCNTLTFGVAIALHKGMNATTQKKISQPAGQWIRTEKRLAIYLRDRFTCIYCLRDLHDADPKDITLDHVKCRSNGGQNSESNLITACRHCNCSRQDKPLSRFAGPETIKHIRRNTRRSLKKYIKLAKSLIAGE